LRAIANARQWADIRAEQVAWLESRNSCGNDEVCLGDLYTGRIAVLEQAQENLAYPAKSHMEIGAAEPSCKAYGRVKSKGSHDPVTVTFTNTSTEYRGVMWLGFDGRPVEYSNIDAGQSYTVNTYAGHIWMFTDGPGNCIELYKAKPGETAFEVSQLSPGFGEGND
jgi:uncharacterized protein